MKGPADAVIAVTHRCNAHCAMCNVWKSRAADRLTADHLRKLPSTLRTVNLSGGEPFLRKDLGDLLAAVREACPRARITLSTNAYPGLRIPERMGELLEIDPRLRLAISLDGLREVHDTVRGDAGAFDSVEQTVRQLTDDGFRGLRLGMTLSGGNYDQLLPVARLASRWGLELGVVAAHDARTHLGTEGLEEVPANTPGVAAEGGYHRGLMALGEAFDGLAARWLRSWRPKLWLRAHFASFTWRRLIGMPWRPRCLAGDDFVFIQADGLVYNCSVRGRPMGDLTGQSWPQIWCSPEADRARRASAACGEACWMICTARSAYRRNALSVLGWVLSAKARAHLGMFRLPGPTAGPQIEPEAVRADPAR